MNEQTNTDPIDSLLRHWFVRAILATFLLGVTCGAIIGATVIR